MRSPIGSLRNVKIFILYLLDNINYPLDYATINDVVRQTDYVMYLDFVEAFHSMLDLELIEKIEPETEDGEELYTITKRGRYCAQEFHGDIVKTMLETALTKALRFLDFKKRGVEIRSWVERSENGKFLVSFTFSEKGVCFFSQTLIVDHEARARAMQDNFYERPEAIYRGVLTLMEGNVNYLFD